MHSEQEAALLAALAAEAGRVVEIGVYEGGSAALLAAAMPPDGELHLIDPFGEQPDALRAGWAADARAARRVVARAARAGPQVHWHVAYSQHVARRWNASIDLLFIDGDHSYAGVRRDFEMYAPLVTPRGGLVAFHDIVPTDWDGCEVHRYWRELAADGRLRTESFTDPAGDRMGGIGVVAAPADLDALAGQAHADQAAA